MRLKLARFGIAPPDKVSLRKNNFAHQSEESYVHIARSRPANHALKQVVALRTMR